MKFTVFIGAPGVGKTFKLKSMSRELDCHIFSPTWFNAEQIGGQTIYNYCGCSYFNFKPKKFVRKYVFIDEIFMFSRKEMNKILLCANEDTVFYLFGDPFQIKCPDDQGGYWYEAVLEIADIHTRYLRTFYRSENDLQLQRILTQYRQDKIIQIGNQFKCITDAQELKKWMLMGATVLVGTHKAKNEIQNKITKLFKKINIPGPDGKMYRQGQTIFTVSKFGSIIESFKFDCFDGDDMILLRDSGKKRIIKYQIKDNHVYYPIISGDCVTVNISQGRTLEKIIIHSSSFFEYGSVYTAISRVRTLEDIRIYKCKGYDKVFEADIDNEFC